MPLQTGQALFTRDFFFFLTIEVKCQSRILSCALFACLLSFFISWHENISFAASRTIQALPLQALGCSQDTGRRHVPDCPHLSSHSSPSSSKPSLNLFIFLAGTASRAQPVPCVFRPPCEVAEACPSGIPRRPPSDPEGSSPLLHIQHGASKIRMVVTHAHFLAKPASRQN